MYFGAGKGDPRLATKVFRAVLVEATHQEPLPSVEAEVLADLTFWVTDDHPVAFREDGTHGWASAASASIPPTAATPSPPDWPGRDDLAAGRRRPEWLWSRCAATDLDNVPMAKAFQRARYVNFQRELVMTWS